MDKLNRNFIKKETERNLLELYEFMAALGTGIIYRKSCASWVITRPSTWPNIIYNSRGHENDSSCLSSVFNAIRQKKAPPFWITGPSSHEVETVLEDNGMVLIDELPGMALDLEAYSEKPYPDSLPEGIEIRMVSTKDELIQWMKIVSTCIFRGKKLDIEMMINVFPQSSMRLYLAYWKGEPASTSMMFRSGKTAGIYNAGTMPVFRRKGLGSILHHFVLNEAYRSGCRLSILHSSYLGMFLWQHLGFQKFCDFRVYWMSGKEFRDF